MRLRKALEGSSWKEAEPVYGSGCSWLQEQKTQLKWLEEGRFRIPQNKKFGDRTVQTWLIL